MTTHDEQTPDAKSNAKKPLDELVALLQAQVTFAKASLQLTNETLAAIRESLAGTE